MARHAARAGEGSSTTAGVTTEKADAQAEAEPKRSQPLGALLATWHSAWNEVKEQVAPKKLVIARHKADKPRLGVTAKNAIKTRSKARNIHLRERTELSLNRSRALNYRIARRAATLAIRDTRAETVNSKRQAAGRDVKACWQLRQELCGKAQASPPQPAVTAQEANEFFVAKPQRQALSKSKTTWSTGIDDVPMAILKKVAEHITPFLAELSNAIICERQWPRCWKEAKVRAVWKNKGSRREIKTYRPIALLPAVSRVVEKIIVKQLMAQIQSAGALPE
eukprot:gene19434-biopygen43770